MYSRPSLLAVAAIKQSLDRPQMRRATTTPHTPSLSRTSCQYSALWTKRAAPRAESGCMLFFVFIFIFCFSAGSFGIEVFDRCWLTRGSNTVRQASQAARDSLTPLCYHRARHGAPRRKEVIWSFSAFWSCTISRLLCTLNYQKINSMCDHEGLDLVD